MTEPPRVFCLNRQALQRAREFVEAGDARLASALDHLRTEADGALTAGPFSVMKKTAVPPSGDRHDYMSFGPYWWPDPTKKDGLPYIRRDGEVNPQSKGGGSDAPALEAMTSAVATLALAWYFTGHDPCADRAAFLLRTWFLAPETRMNPHLEYGQAIPGILEGRGIGIIDTHRLVDVVDAVGLLASWPGWAPPDQEGMERWMAAYLDWLLESDHGKDEARQPNNHGTWYDVQVACLALFVGRREVARGVVEASRQRRIARHVQPDGSQPNELHRTRTLDYSLFNLRALMLLAELGESVGVDLWRYEPAGAAGLRAAIDFVAPYSDPAVRWPHRQILPPTAAWSLFPLVLRRAALAYDAPQYLRCLENVPHGTDALHRAALVYPADRRRGRGASAEQGHGQ